MDSGAQHNQSKGSSHFSVELKVFEQKREHPCPQWPKWATLTNVTEGNDPRPVMELVKKRLGLTIDNAASKSAKT